MDGFDSELVYKALREDSLQYVLPNIHKTNR